MMIKYCLIILFGINLFSYGADLFKETVIPLYMSVGDSSLNINGLDIKSYFSINGEIKNYNITFAELRNKKDKSEFDVAFLKTVDIINSGASDRAEEVMDVSLFASEEEMRNEIDTFHAYYKIKETHKVLFCTKVGGRYTYYIEIENKNIPAPSIGVFEKRKNRVVYRAESKSTRAGEEIYQFWLWQSMRYTKSGDLTRNKFKRQSNFSAQIKLEDDYEVSLDFDGTIYPYLDFRNYDDTIDEVAKLALNYWSTLENEPFEEVEKLYLPEYKRFFNDKNFVDKAFIDDARFILKQNPKLMFIFHFKDLHVAVFKTDFKHYKTVTIYKKNGKNYLTNFCDATFFKRLFERKQTFIDSFIVPVVEKKIKEEFGE